MQTGRIVDRMTTMTDAELADRWCRAGKYFLKYLYKNPNRNRYGCLGTLKHLIRMAAVRVGWETAHTTIKFAATKPGVDGDVEFYQALREIGGIIRRLSDHLAVEPGWAWSDPEVQPVCAGIMVKVTQCFGYDVIRCVIDGKWTGEAMITTDHQMKKSGRGVPGRG